MDMVRGLGCSEMGGMARDDVWFGESGGIRGEMLEGWLDEEYCFPVKVREAPVEDCAVIGCYCDKFRSEALNTGNYHA